MPCSEFRSDSWRGRQRVWFGRLRGCGSGAGLNFPGHDSPYNFRHNRLDRAPDFAPEIAPDITPDITQYVIICVSLNNTRDVFGNRPQAFARRCLGKVREQTLSLCHHFQNRFLRNLAQGRVGGRFRMLEAVRGSRGRMRQLDGSFHHLAQPLQRREIALAKGIHLPRKQLEDAQHFIVVHHRHHHYRCDSHPAADVAVHAHIALGIVTAQNLAPAHALAGKPKLRRKQRAQLRSVDPRTGAAQHVALSDAAQRNRRPGRAGDVLSAVGEQLQSGVEIAVCHLRQGMTTILWGAGVGGRQSGGKAGLRSPSCAALLHYPSVFVPSVSWRKLQ